MDLSIIEQVGTALVAVLVLGIGTAVPFLVRKVKYEYAKDVLDRLGEFAILVVREMWQTVVQAAKAASPDGKLTSETAKEVKGAAIEKLKSYLGPKGISALLWLLGLSNKSLEELLGGAIEAAITAEKK